MSATETRSPEFLEGYRAYRAGDTLMHCPFGTFIAPKVFFKPIDCEKYAGWYTAWEDYQDRLHQQGE